MVDENTPLEPQFAPEPVDESKIRRSSMWKGALRFAKNGMLVGAVAGLVLTGGMLGTGLIVGKTLLGATASACGGLMMMPGVNLVAGPICGGAAVAAVGTVASHVAKYGLLGTGMQALFAVGSVAIPVVIGGIVLGAVVGLAWGAAHGAADAEKDIEKAELAAKVEAHRLQVAHHRREYEKAQLQQTKLEFAQQGRDMGLEPGYLPSPRTPAQNAPNERDAGLNVPTIG